MLKVEEYKLLMLLRKIKDTPVAENDTGTIPSAHQITNASTILKDEFANMNNLVMSPILSKEIIVTHLRILMQSLNYLQEKDDRDDVMRNCYLITETLSIDDFFSNNIELDIDLWGNNIFESLKMSSDTNLRGIINQKLLSL